MIVIKFIKYWTKVVQQESVDHVQIKYSVDDKVIDVHQFGNKAVAAPEFYKALEDFSSFVCTAAGLSKDLASAISVREITIKPNEDSEGNDTTIYVVACDLKSGHTATALAIKVQHKFLPEGFGEAILDIVEEAEEYVNGKRAQVEMELDGESNENGDPDDIEGPEDSDEVTDKTDETDLFTDGQNG